MAAITNRDWRKSENHLDEDESKWFAVYTRSKSEKKLCKGLEKKKIEAYVPLLEKTRIYGRKKRVVSLPLINCYVFVKIVKSQYISVLEMQEVISFVRFSQNLVSIPEKEIKLLQKIVGNAQDIELEGRPLTPGRAVEIIAGALTGIKGTLLSQKNKNEFIVELEHIGINLRMSVPKENLQRVRR